MPRSFKRNGELIIEIEGLPISKARPYIVHKKKDGTALDRPIAVNKQQSQEGRFLAGVLAAIDERPEMFQGALEVKFWFIFPILKSWPKYKKRAVLEGKEVISHVVKPDVSNLIKFPEDILNRLLWHDDGQIAALHGFKFYGERPKTVIKISKLKQPDLTRYRR